MDKVVHFEIPADDLERAQKFYKSIFGWDIIKTPMPGAEYYIVHTVKTDKEGMPQELGAINGGMMKRMAKGEAPVIVINVANLDEYSEKVKKGGGRVVMPKMQVGDMGLYARITDTEGNIIGLWQDLKQH